MNSKPNAIIETRDARQLLAELMTRRSGYVPDWTAQPRSAGAGLATIFSSYWEAVTRRLNQAPDKNKLAFFDLAGLGLIAAQAARVPVVFQLAGDAAGGSAPAETAIAAPPPPGGTRQILFATERAAGLTSGKLVQVFSLWPGRDEYIDHSKAYLAGQPVRAFAADLRRPVPHQLFLSHPVLLALSGNVILNVHFELSRAATSRMDALWEYWDGAVWRGFLSTNPECQPVADSSPDGTNGFQRSGSFTLRADCAQASKTTVDGKEGYWIRGRLTQPLPPDDAQALPEVDQVRLSTTVNRALSGRLAVSEPLVRPTGSETKLQRLSFHSQNSAGLGGCVLNQAGQPVEGAQVTAEDLAGSKFVSASTAPDGLFELPSAPFARYRYTVVFGGIEFAHTDVSLAPKEAPSQNKPFLELTITVEGLKPDKAFADATPLDVSKAFFPIGQQPQPGGAYYFTCGELFAKPGAEARIYVARTRSPQDEAAVKDIAGVASNTAGTITRLEHKVAWEYWNGRLWAPLVVTSNRVASKFDLDSTEILDFTVPLDMAPLEWNGETQPWIRMRLESGSYGFRQELTFKTGSDEAKFAVVHLSPPAISAFAIGYTWVYGPFFPEQTVTYNDFQYTDQSYPAVWPGATFRPFDRVKDITPALYLGFNKKPPADQLGIFFDIQEDAQESRGPALIWEYWDGLQWDKLAEDDETGNLRRPGIAAVLLQPDDAPLARFGTALHWIRARLKEDGPPGEPLFTAIYPNAVWASERSTLRDLPIGASRGTPGEVFLITQTPVLPGEQLEVRELAGARANVEWRILAMELSAGDAAALRDIEEQLGREGPETDVVRGSLRLRRNRKKQVIEAWVRWTSRPFLYFSAPDDRHYEIDRASGKVWFGDGTNGKIPPAGSAIVIREMSSGGGSGGNVATGTVTQLLGVVPGFQSLTNPKPGEGGADGETSVAALSRAPRTLHHRGRAIGRRDYETLAREASPAVAFARALPGRNIAGLRLPGWLTILILPHSKDRRPFPSFGLREHVRRFLAERAPAELAALGRIQVEGPRYAPVDVKATVAPVKASEAANVERRAREALEQFLHPLYGGPQGEGWDLGRDVYLSDIAAVLEKVEGMDYVSSLALLHESVPQGESLAVAEDCIVAPGTITLLIESSGR